MVASTPIKLNIINYAVPVGECGLLFLIPDPLVLTSQANELHVGVVWGVQQVDCSFRFAVFTAKLSSNFSKRLVLVASVPFNLLN